MATVFGCPAKTTIHFLVQKHSLIRSPCYCGHVFFGLLVTVLTGFHCALLIEVVDVFNIIIENDRWWSLFFPQSSVLRANSKMTQIDDKRRGSRQRAKNESYMQASLIRRGKRFWVSSSRKLGREE